MTKTTCPAKHKPALLSFMRDFPFCQVRDILFSQNNPIPALRFEGCMQFPQLRSKKHDHLAMVTDELGNQFVLTAKGKRVQLIDEETF